MPPIAPNMTRSWRPAAAATWTRRLIGGVVVVMALLGRPRAADAAGDDHEARAATIAQALRFVVWQAPATRGRDLRVAVVGDAALGAALREASASLRPGGRAVTVVNVESPRRLDRARAAVVVVGALPDPAVEALAQRLSQRGIVTIGDDSCPDSTHLTLRLVDDGDRYRVQANPAAAARAGVGLSSRLLRVAQVVN